MREVFARQGYAETSLDDLCEASGLSRPSLYAAFGDKERVYIAALECYAGKQAAAIEQALALPDRLGVRLALIFGAAAAAFCQAPEQPGCMLGGTAASAAPTHPEIRTVAARLRAAGGARFEAAFAAAGADADARTRAEMVLAALDSMGLRARLGENEASLVTFGQAVAARLTSDLTG
jgi:AcrR family transcriptional regulator